MSADLIARIIGMLAFSIGGAFAGNGIANFYHQDQPLIYTLIFGLVGALIGLVVTPYLTTRPACRLRAWLTLPVCRYAHPQPGRSHRRPVGRSPAGIPTLPAPASVWQDPAVRGCLDLWLPGCGDIRDAQV